MNRIKDKELNEILEKHKVWLGSSSGERACLRGEVLRLRRLKGSMLSGADLCRADLRDSDLREVNLEYANLVGANLRGAILRGADLRGANLWGADFTGANLMDAKISWNSHELIAEILRQDAGEEREKRELAGLILISTDWCWEHFKEEAKDMNDDLLDWAARTLLYVAGNPEGAPDLIKSRVDDISDFE